MAWVKHHAFLLIIVAGLAARLLTVVSPGTADMYTNQLWGARAVEKGLARAYIFDDAYYIEKAVSRWKHVPYESGSVGYLTQLGLLDHVPNYPPLSIFLFGFSSWACRSLHSGTLRKGPLLNACFNLVPIAASLATVLLVWSFARREGWGNPLGFLAWFWLNPAMLLHTPVLGYVDAVSGVFALHSLVSLYRRQHTRSVFSLALSCMIKPQGVLILPVVAGTLLAERDRSLVWRMGRRFLLFLLLPFVPFAMTGNALGALRGTFQVIDIGYLSWQQTNLWWLASWALPAFAGKGLASLAHQVRMHGHREFADLTGVDPRPVALMLLGLFIAISLAFLLRELRKGNRLAIFWAAALQVYGFTMLSLYPHENHLYAFFVYLLPLLALPDRTFVRFFVTLAVIFGLNMYLFDGVGRGVPSLAPVLRSFLGFDTTVAVAAANLLIFVWLLRSQRWCFDRSAVPRRAVGVELP